MDYDDLLNGLVGDLQRDPDSLPDPPDLPAELVLVEDGEPNPEQIARLDYLRDYAVMVHGTAILELVEEDDDSETLVVQVLDPTNVRISVEENEVEVARIVETDEELRPGEPRLGVERIENAVVETHSGEQEHYGSSPVEEVGEEANVLRDLELDSIALTSEENAYENSSLGPVRDAEEHGEQ